MIDIIRKIKLKKQILDKNINTFIKKIIKKMMSEDRANSIIETIIICKNDSMYFNVLMIVSIISITVGVLNFNKTVYVKPQYSLQEYAYAFQTGYRKIGHYKIDNTISIVGFTVGFISLFSGFLLRPFSILEKIENFIQSIENKKQVGKGNYLSKEEAEKLKQEIIELKQLYQHKDSDIEK